MRNRMQMSEGCLAEGDLPASQPPPARFEYDEEIREWRSQVGSDVTYYSAEEKRLPQHRGVPE